MYPPPAEKITTLICQTFFGNHRFPTADFSSNCSKLILPEVTDTSCNPCSSPVHIASHCAETRPNIPVIAWFPGNPNVINSTNKKMPVIFLEGTGWVRPSSPSSKPGGGEGWGVGSGKRTYPRESFLSGQSCHLLASLLCTPAEIACCKAAASLSQLNAPGRSPLPARPPCCSQSDAICLVCSSDWICRSLLLHHFFFFFLS